MDGRDMDNAGTGCWAVPLGNDMTDVYVTNPGMGNEVNVGLHMTNWFLLGFAGFVCISGIEFLRAINFAACKNDCLNVLLACPYCLILIAMLVWFVWGFFIRFDQAGWACVTDRNTSGFALLPKFGKMFNWYYGINFAVIGIVIIVACISFIFCDPRRR